MLTRVMAYWYRHGHDPAPRWGFAVNAWPMPHRTGSGLRQPSPVHAAPVSGRQPPVAIPSAAACWIAKGIVLNGLTNSPLFMAHVGRSLASALRSGDTVPISNLRAHKVAAV